MIDIKSFYGEEPFQVLREEEMICPCCMEKHKVTTVVVADRNLVKGGWVNYTAVHNYCENAETLFDDEAMMDFNYALMTLATKVGSEGVTK